MKETKGTCFDICDYSFTDDARELVIFFDGRLIKIA